MTALSRLELDRALKAGRLSPLYLLIGVESYLRDAAARAITIEALRGTLLREFNDSHFSLAAGDGREAIAVAEQLPMMSRRRTVLVSDFGKLREAAEDVLIRYLSQPAESSVVIFVADDLDKRKRLTKVLLETCTVVEFPALSDDAARFWAKERLKELGVGLDDRVLSEIVALVGTSIQTLSCELEKLATAALGTGRITMELVDQLIGRSRELSNFYLSDHLIGRDRRRALETLHRLLDGGAEPVMLIGLIASNYHRLALAKDLLTHGSREDVFRHVPMPGFKRSEFLATVQRSSPVKIAQAIKRIAATDLAIKTSQATPRLQLEMLVCELAG